MYLPVVPNNLKSSRLRVQPKRHFHTMARARKRTKQNTHTHLDKLEFAWLDDIQDLLDLIEEHDFLRTVGLGPVTQQPQCHLHKPVKNSDPCGKTTDTAHIS